MSQTLQDKKWILETGSLEEKSNLKSSTRDTSLKQDTMSDKLQATTVTTASSTVPPAAQAAIASLTGSSSNRLAQEIYDEFLVCKICLDGYKNPKCLDCLHTFCETCIETHVNSEPAYKKYSDYREFTCPLCRKRTQLPVGGVKKLPDNFLVSSLTEVVGRQKPPVTPSCDICKLVAKVEKEATSKCLDCSKLLCASCVALHKNTKVTSNHSLFDVEIEKEIGCKDHQDEVVRFYCEPCQTCVCVLCTFNEHRDHAISQFQDVAVKYKANIEDLLASCKTKIQVLETQLESVNACETTIKQVEQTIRDKSIEYIQLIRDREKQLLEELHQAYGQECFEAIDGKKDLIHQVENIKNTCNISEVILLGKEIELLLLKKDVEEKLNLMNQVEARSLPDTINKIVDFQTGQVDLGYLVHQTEGMTSRETVVLKARKVENGKATSRWMAATVVSATDPAAAGVTSVASVAGVAGTSAVKEQSNVAIKRTPDCYEIMESKEHGVQTDFQDSSRSELEVEDEDGVVRRRRRKPEEGTK